MIVLTLFALACLPCLLAMLVTADIAAEAMARAVRRRLRALRGRHSERRLAREVGIKDRPVTTHPTGPPIEQIAATEAGRSIPICSRKKKKAINCTRSGTPRKKLT